MEPTPQQRENAEKYFVPKYLGKIFKYSHQSLMGVSEYKSKCVHVDTYIVWDEAEEQHEYWESCKMYLVEITLYDSSDEKITTEYRYINWKELNNQ